MKCPDCGLIASQAAFDCECGHDFKPGVSRTASTNAGASTSTATSSSLGNPVFHGSGGSLMKIHIINLLLTFATLGVYFFWAKVKIRKYFYNETEIGGDRFDYHGTGKELMIGWLKVAVVFVVVFGAIGAMQTVWRGPMTQLLANLLLYTGLLFLVPVAIVGSRRYRLSRSSWRGIRFSFRGHAKEFIRIFVPGALLAAVTLGLYTPYFENNVRAYLTDHAYFGTRKFNYDGQGSDLFSRYLMAYLLLFPTLGLYWFWFTAWRQRYYWSHTSYEGLCFRSDVTGGGLLGLSLGNLALLVLTLGLAWPWVLVRKARYTLDHLSVQGSVDLSAIKQEAQTASATGEGMAEFLDTGLLDADVGI